MMSAGEQGWVMGWRGRLLALIGVSALALAISLAMSTARADAAAPEKTDVMFIFDTSGSMEGVLTEAKEEIKTLVANTEASLPNAEFGVANVEDIPGYFGQPLESFLTEQEYAEDAEKPWHLWQPLTSDEKEVEEAINKLSESEVAHSGGDLPEAYGRALYETATNPQVKWRAGARHEIVLIADNVPHTPNVDEGIPPEFWLENPFATGEESPGKFGIQETQWKAGESLEFHKTLQKLGAEEKPLAMVDYFHTAESESENYIHYWEYWAAATGGQAITADEGAKTLDAKLAAIIKESAEGIPPCPPDTERTATTPCKKKTVPPPPAPKPIVSAPPTSPPVPKTVIINEEGGEIEDELEFPEAGEAELSGEVSEGAEAASFHGLPANLLSQPTAFTAKEGKGRKCKKGYVKKGKKCVNNAPIQYGLVKLTIPSAGKYKLKLKPSAKALAALKQGKSLRVKLTLEFTPAGTTTHLLSTTTVKVHLRPKKHHKHKHRR
jgi:VCBS repeat-containing protein